MSSNRFSALIALGVLSAAPVYATPYTVDPATSKIAFSGEQAGTKFDGVFEKWAATIDFDAKNLDKSSLDVTITTASAKTGNKMYDGALPQKDWFNAEAFPTAHFKSTKITAAKDGGYIAEGQLTIKDVSKPVTFNFTIDDLTKPAVHAASVFKIDRLEYHLGVESDGKAEWVSKDIAVSLDIHASIKTP